MPLTPHRHLIFESKINCVHEFPFRVTTDPRFFYQSRSGQAVYDSLLTGVQDRQGLMLLVGDAGTGKTTLLLRLKEALELSNCLVVFPRRGMLSFDELIQVCCETAGVTQQPVAPLDKVQAFANVVVERVDDNGATAIFIDDAQALSDEFLAGLSHLIKITSGDINLLQIILAGQPELVARLGVSQLPFAKDCAIAFQRLGHLDVHEVEEYIAYRLARAGHQAQPFTPNAIMHIAEFSNGIPRVINQICGMSQMVAEMEDAGAISTEIIDKSVLALRGNSGQITASANPPGAITSVSTNEAGRKLVEEPAEVEDINLQRWNDDKTEKGFTDRLAKWESVIEADMGADCPPVDPDFRRLAIDLPDVEADLTGGVGNQEAPDLSVLADFEPKKQRPEEHLFDDVPRRGRPAIFGGILLIGLIVGSGALVYLKLTGSGLGEQVATIRASRTGSADDLPQRGDTAESILEPSTPNGEAPPPFEPEAEVESPEVTQNVQIDLHATNESDEQWVLEGNSTASLDGSEFAVEQRLDESSGLAKVPELKNGSGKVETMLEVLEGVSQPAELRTPQASDEAQTALSDSGGNFFLQLASMRLVQNAYRELDRLTTLHGDLLSDFELTIDEAYVNGLVYHRVRSAPFSGKDKAYRACAKLQARSQKCIVRQLPTNLIENTSPTVNVTGTTSATAAVEGANRSERTIPASLGSLVVRDLVLSHEVAAREPVGVTERFSTADLKAYAYAVVRNLGPPKNVAFVWRHQDAVISRYETRIGRSEHWRTWSSAELRPGDWVVQLVTEDGDVLAEAAFMVD